PACISTSTESQPASRAAFRPDPTPNQPGTICRDWVQPNTHGMARNPSIPPPESGRRLGREPMFSEPSCSTGVEDRKYSGNPGSSMNLRYAANAVSLISSMVESQLRSCSALCRGEVCRLEPLSTAATV